MTNNTGSSRTSTNNSIYIHHQIITYNPTLAAHGKKGKKGRTKEGRTQQTSTAERASQQKQRRRGQTVQAKPRTYEATKIRYVGASSVAIVGC